MKPTPIFRGRIEQGRIKLDRRDEFAAHVARLDGKDIELRLTRWRRVRSGAQNRYYWAVVVPLIADHCGYDHQEMHEALKFRYLQTHEGPMPRVRSTADLSTAEFTEYIDAVRRLAAEMGCVIPGPGEIE
jgi:hypothetical protein